MKRYSQYRLLALGLLSQAFLLSTTSASHAYCRATDCGADNDGAICAVDSEGCVVDGLPLGWALGSKVSVGLSADELGAEDEAAWGEAVERAVQSWSEVECGQDGGPDVTLDMSGSSSEESQILVRLETEEWIFHENALARTVLEYDTVSGAISSATIWMNLVKYPLVATEESDASGGQGGAGGARSTEGINILGILTHELGHALGLGHTSVTGATMESEAESSWIGEIASLEDDDRSGLCALYPQFDFGEAGGAGGETNYFDVSDDVVPPPTDGKGICSVSAHDFRGNDAQGAILAVLLVLGITATRRGLRKHPIL